MTKHQTRPTTAAIHAAHVATRAAVTARRMGADPARAAGVYAAAYAAAIREAA